MNIFQKPNSLFGEPITSFDGEYRFLSNFHPCFVKFAGLNYPSVEHAYVASKTRDENLRRIVSNTETPGKAKRIGRTLTLRDDWEDVRIGLMTEFIRQKFTYIPLAQQLKDTDEVPIIEGNTWNDRFWGQCPIGTGENNLGKILMKQRDILQNE